MFISLEDFSNYFAEEGGDHMMCSGTGYNTHEYFESLTLFRSENLHPALLNLLMFIKMFLDPNCHLRPSCTNKQNSHRVSSIDGEVFAEGKMISGGEQMKKISRIGERLGFE